MQISSEDGVSIFCREEGIGPPLLLIHGTSSDGTSWQPIVPMLASAFTVHAMDRRGHGRSEDGTDYRIEKEYADVRACIDAVSNGTPVNVVAHSYGGLCALGAARLTRNIGKLVLFEPPIPTYPQAYYPADLILRMREALAKDDRDGAMEAFARGVFRNSDSELAEMRKLAMWPQMARETPKVLRELEAVDSFVLNAGDYRDADITALLLLGGESPPQYRATIEALHERLPQSRIGILEGQQHKAMKTAPALFAAKVMEFLTAPSP